MLDTARRNLELTALASGHHHIGDFLPQQELDRFLRRADAVKTGAAVPVVSDYESNKLTEDNNIGYQMLVKSGWKEGTSLGAITNSNSNSSSGGTGAGSVSSFGSSSTSTVSRTGVSTGSIGARLVEPVNATSRTAETVGLGVQAPHEPEAQDSEFDQYRKRMMLAYRFRPNPLNNPRRDY